MAICKMLRTFKVSKILIASKSMIGVQKNISSYSIIVEE